MWSENKIKNWYIKVGCILTTIYLCKIHEIKGWLVENSIDVTELKTEGNAEN